MNDFLSHSCSFRHRCCRCCRFPASHPRRSFCSLPFRARPSPHRLAAPAPLPPGRAGFQSLDLAHLFSQAALTFASTFMAARSCTVYLAPALRQHLEGGGAARLLRLLPQRWAAAVRAGEPELVCRGYAMGLQVGSRREGRGRL